MNWRLWAVAALLPWICPGAWTVAGETRFSRTFSRGDYAHWIELYDQDNRMIDPADPGAAPYSPVHTCGRCHDYEAIGHGHHFNAAEESVAAGRPSEPWLWSDDRTGTQIPLSYRNWPGTYDPRTLEVSGWDFVLKFGRHLPGGSVGVDAAAAGGSTEAAESETAEGDGGESPAHAGRWQLSGPLAIDCMICHAKDTCYSAELRWDQIGNENFAWAPTVALGLGHVEGKVSSLPDDFDPTSEDAEDELPKTAYAQHRINAEKKAFFDIVRTPDDRTCYYCHTTHFVGSNVAPEWSRDQDVHLRAGMSCSDCHRNGIEHHTVRGFEGEVHPAGELVDAFSCRGCHMDEARAGRMGAPVPVHAGLPPLHFDKLSCTACHSGPRPSGEALQVLTAMAHGLGLPSHDYSEDLPPGIVEPVFLREGETLYPHRMVWPAFWARLSGEQITPLNPEEVYGALRRTLRVRRTSNFTETVSKVRITTEDKAEVLGEERAKVADSELSEGEKEKLESLRKQMAAEAFREKLAEALEALKEILPEDDSQPIYIAGGRAYRLDDEGVAETFQHAAAEPYAWRFGHDVRPARDSAGVTGCTECHADGSGYFTSTVTALGPAPDNDPPSFAMHELAGYDKTLLDVWNLSFLGRTAFKWLGFASIGVVGLVLLAYSLLGIVALARFVRRS